MGRAPQTKTVATRLRENSDESPDGCWLWNKSTVTGYGQMWVGSRADGSRRRVLAHRASYETFVGPVPEGMDVDHLCFNRLCINPAHLEPVTPKENVRRHWARPSTATELPPYVAHDEQVRAEALAPVLALADEWEAGSLPYYFGEGGRRILDDVDLRDLTAALRAAAGTPTHDTTKEER